MNDRELAAWLAAHGGEVARTNNEKTHPQNANNPFDENAGKTYIDSTTITARDGAKIEIRRQAPEDNPEGGIGPTRVPYEVIGTTPPRQELSQTPDQQRAVQLENAKRERDAADAEQEAKEKQWNHDNPKPNPITGELRAYYETHQQRATREAAELQQVRQQQADARQAALDKERIDAQTQSNQIAQGGLEVSRGQLQETIAEHLREANKPTYLAQADPKNPNIVRFNPASGLMESMPNPNYDKVKEEAEQLRQNLATQIQAGQLRLEEAKQQYSQWFDTNVKTPLALAQEARDKAAEQRAALDAEERRRQFAASFSLQRGELGQRAGATAIQAEESLLPYRAGPDEAADMSSAINSLGAGGSMSTNASAGINFKASDFEFNAPDFKSIARNAAKDALKGISNYIPSDQQYSTADYSGVPAVNTSGAPAVPNVSGGFQGALDTLKGMYQYGGSQ